MIMLLALSSSAPDAAAASPLAARAAHAAVTAGASVRLLTPASASQRDWKKADLTHKREILVREADGRTTRLRLIEHE